MAKNAVADSLPPLFALKGVGVVGVDLGLSSCGIAWRSIVDPGCYLTLAVGAKIKRNASTMDRARRLADLSRRVVDQVAAISPQLVVVENYALAGQHRSFDIAELGGVVRADLVRRGLELALVEPKAARAIVFPDEPKAGLWRKDELLEAARRRWAFLGERTGDEADALVLLLCGEAMLDTRPSIESTTWRKRVQRLRERNGWS